MLRSAKNFSYKRMSARVSFVSSLSEYPASGFPSMSSSEVRELSERR